MRHTSKTLILPFLVFSTAAPANIIETTPDETLTISAPAGGAGVTVELPLPVRLVAGARTFRVSPVGAETDEKNLRPANVRYFHISASRKAQPEVVTFVMGLAGQAPSRLHLRLIPTGNSTAFTTIRFVTTKLISASRFLRPEAELMRSMIRDDDTFQRRTLSEPIREAGSEKLRISLIRTYQKEDLQGRVFEIRNTTQKPVTVDPRLATGGKNEIPLLVHVGRDILPACAKGETGPESRDSCVTRMHFVMRSSQPKSAQQIPRPATLTPSRNGEVAQ